MSRYIDADNLKKDIARLHVLHDEKEIRRLYYANPHTSLADFEEILVRIFDAIEAAPTIDAIPRDFHDKTCEAMAKRHLEELEKYRWIPCSERLPKRQGYYICTCKDGSKYKRTTTVKWSNGWQLAGARSYWIVLAWMPLPKPWEGVDDD